MKKQKFLWESGVTRWHYFSAYLASVMENQKSHGGLALVQHLAGVRVEKLEFHENLHWKLALVQHRAGIVKHIQLQKDWQDYSIVGTFQHLALWIKNLKPGIRNWHWFSAQFFTFWAFVSYSYCAKKLVSTQLVTSFGSMHIALFQRQTCKNNVILFRIMLKQNN